MAKRLRRFPRKEEIAGSKRVATSAAFENPARGSIYFILFKPWSIDNKLADFISE